MQAGYAYATLYIMRHVSRRPSWVLTVTLLLLIVLAGRVILHAGPVTTLLQPRTYASSTIPDFSHIFQITLENTSYFHLVGSSDAPYFNSLVAKGGLATEFYGFTHYSLPNYFVMTAGQTSTSSYVLNDCDGTTADCTQSYVSLPEEIESSGHTWKAYFQSMPSNCDINGAWPYTPHYNPFVYYTRLLNSGDCAKNVVPDTQFYSDLANHTLPNYIWMSPDLCHDGHLSTGSGNTCPNGGPYTDFPSGIAQADAWLSGTIPQILASPEYKNGGLLIITWDEGDQGGNGFSEDSSGCCGVANGGHIATLLLSPSIAPGIQKAVPETFYSLLRTIEASWSLNPLANEANFSPMAEFFTPAASAPVPSPTPTVTSSSPSKQATPTAQPAQRTTAPTHTPAASSLAGTKQSPLAPPHTSHQTTTPLLIGLAADVKAVVVNYLLLDIVVGIALLAAGIGAYRRWHDHGSSPPPPQPPAGITVG